jgi:hypothetical protein
MSGIPERKPVAVNAKMSASEMAELCGLMLRRESTWKYSVYSQTDVKLEKRLYSGTMIGIKAWLKREKYVI